jgi:hypothetical protein
MRKAGTAATRLPRTVPEGGFDAEASGAIYPDDDDGMRNLRDCSKHRWDTHGACIDWTSGI